MAQTPYIFQNRVMPAVSSLDLRAVGLGVTPFTAMDMADTLDREKLAIEREKLAISRESNAIDMELAKYKIAQIQKEAIDARKARYRDVVKAHKDMSGLSTLAENAWWENADAVDLYNKWDNRWTDLVSNAVTDNLSEAEIKKQANELVLEAANDPKYRQAMQLTQAMKKLQSAKEPLNTTLYYNALEDYKNGRITNPTQLDPRNLMTPTDKMNDAFLKNLKSIVKSNVRSEPEVLPVPGKKGVTYTRITTYGLDRPTLMNITKQQMASSGDYLKLLNNELTAYNLDTKGILPPKDIDTFLNEKALGIVNTLIPEIAEESKNTILGEKSIGIHYPSTGGGGGNVIQILRDQIDPTNPEVDRWNPKTGAPKGTNNYLIESDIVKDKLSKLNITTSTAPKVYSEIADLLRLGQLNIDANSPIVEYPEAWGKTAVRLSTKDEKGTKVVLTNKGERIARDLYKDTGFTFSPENFTEVISNAAGKKNTSFKKQGDAVAIYAGKTLLTTVPYETFNESVYKKKTVVKPPVKPNTDKTKTGDKVVTDKPVDWNAQVKKTNFSGTNIKKRK